MTSLRVTIDAREIADGVRRLNSALDRNLALALDATLDVVAARARQTSTFKDRSGAGRKSIQASGVRGRFGDGTLHGYVTAGEKYMLWLDEGTKAHFVKPTKKKALRWAVGGGFRFSKGHRVSGIKARDFMFTALNESATDMQKFFTDATALAFRQAGF